MPRDDNSATNVETWLRENHIADVEIIVSDFAGISRGKIMPVAKFLSGLDDKGHRVPESLFGLGVNCGFSFNEYITELEEDYYLIPDFDTLRVIPWYDVPTASVICDTVRENNQPTSVVPRQVLRNVLDAYDKQGWAPILAPEFEFYLIAKQDQIEATPLPPRGMSGKVAWDTGELSITGLEEFNALFSDVQKYCQGMNVDIDTLTHEAGPAQFEFNIEHGNPLSVADQSFFFKRIMKRTSIKHNMFATFMAKPYPDHYGSAMHVHQSVVDAKTGENIFADAQGNNTDLFMSYIAGLQKYIPAAMLLLAPYSNSYLRICDDEETPVNTSWGSENRSVGFRIPQSDRNSRRVENRIAGADVNPYLAFAATLAAGYLGMVNNLKPSQPTVKNAYRLDENKLPQHLSSAWENLDQCKEMREILSDHFVSTFLEVKREEYKANMNVLSQWELRYLLLNV